MQWNMPVGARLNQQGLNSISDLVEDFIADYDIAAIILAVPPIDENFSGIRVQAEITNAVVGPAAVQINSTWSGLSLIASMGPLAIDADVTLEVLGTPTLFQIGISATSIGITADVAIGASGGDLTVELTNLQITMNNFQLSASGMTQAQIDAVSAVIEDLVEGMVSDMILDEVQPLIADVLADLDLSFSFNLTGIDFDLTASFQSVDFQPTGGTIWLDAVIESSYEDPNTPQFTGSYYTSGVAPTFYTTAPNGTGYGFGFGLADDLLNQALHEIYRSGMATIHIDQAFAQQWGFTWDLTTTDLALFIPRLALLYPATPVEFWLAPKLPPILQFSAVKSSSAGLTLQMGDFLVSMMVVPDGQTPVEAFTMALALEVPVTVTVDTAANTLSMAFGTPTVSVDIFNELVDFNDALVEGLAPVLIGFIMPYLGQLLGEFPIPALQGFTINLIDLAVFGNQDDYLGVFGDLQMAKDLSARMIGEMK